LVSLALQNARQKATTATELPLKRIMKIIFNILIPPETSPASCKIRPVHQSIWMRKLSSEEKEAKFQAKERPFLRGSNYFIHWLMVTNLLLRQVSQIFCIEQKTQNYRGMGVAHSNTIEHYRTHHKIVVFKLE
jgi:hypothetical protein